MWCCASLDFWHASLALPILPTRELLLSLSYSGLAVTAAIAGVADQCNSMSDHLQNQKPQYDKSKPWRLILQVPSGLLPAMELDGELYTESDLIMQILEERFPERPLMPSKGSPSYHRAQKLLRLERQLFGVWLQWLCRSW